MTVVNGHDYTDDVLVGDDGKAYDDPPPWAAANDPRPAFPDWLLADLLADTTIALQTTIPASFTFSVGSVAIVLAAARPFQVGAWAVITNSGATKQILGQITAVADTTHMTFNGTYVVAGSGSASGATIQVSGPQGPIGPAGTTTAEILLSSLLFM